LLDLEKHLKKKEERRKGGDDIHLVVRHIPGTFNVLADCLSRFHNPVNTEWELRQVVFHSVVLRWDRPHVDLFATSLNHKLETFVSPAIEDKEEEFLCKEEREHDSEFLLESASRPLLLYCPSLALLLSKLEES
jgi:hypothetical protein